MSIGPLGLRKFEAHISPHTGLSVCKNMLWSPDSFGLNEGSLVLFYGDVDGSNHMLTHDVQDTAWKYNHTFLDSSAESGIECTCRGDEIVDAWMIGTKGQVLQASLNFNLTSNQTAYTPGQWKNGTIYDGPILGPTSISAIKYTGNDTFVESNSTFIYINPGNNTIIGFNVDTSNRSQVPAHRTDNGTISNQPIVSGSKFATVDLRTDKIDPNTKVYGVENKIIVQPASNPSQMLMTRRNFGADGTSFDPDGKASEIHD